MTGNKKIGFGKDFTSILGTTVENEKNVSVKDEIQYIPSNFIVPGKFQPRNNFYKEPIEELAASIKSQGIIQPLILREIEVNKFEIVAGERRWRAAQLIGLETLPSVIRDIDDRAAVAISLIENIQRQDLNPIEEANAYKKLQNEFQMTQDEIATSVGKARSTITNIIRLLDLNEEVQKLLEKKQIEVGHAKLLLSFNANEQIQLSQIIIDKKLTVRETERLIKSFKKGELKSEKNTQEGIKDCQIVDWITRLTRHLHSKIDINVSGNGKGKVVISLDSRDEIEWLVKKLEKI